MKNHKIILILLLTITHCTLTGQNCILKIKNPVCEGLENPVGINMLQPRFSWQLESACPDQQQSAYQILVASSKAKLQQNDGDIWNSQKLLDSNSLHIPFDGKSLKTAQTCFWKVKVWNGNDEASDWSSIQQWTTGVISKQDIHGKWTGLNIPEDVATLEQKKAAHYFFTNFKTNTGKTLRQATAFVSGLGLFDFYINGERVSDHRLNPANTNYSKRAIYVGFDVTKFINNDENAIGVVLGNGKHLLDREILRKYGLPRLWCQLHLQYEDGSTQIVKSDGNWKMTTKGPIRFNHEFDGEHYDARMEIENWATAKMDTSGWQKVDVLNDYQPFLTPQMMPPVRVVDTLLAKNISKSGEGKFIVDFGQNMTGWTKLQTRGNRGDTIRMRFTELLDSLGQLDTLSIRGAKATDVFILKGNGLESFEPRFTYHGFRYVEISGLRKAPDAATLKACVAHNDLKAVGNFSCSDPLLNKIYQNARWSIRGNYQHVPVDCPQRDERYGWLGDRSATAFGELYMFDIHQLYSKWMQDIADEQLDSGALPNMAPAHWEVYRDNVTWPAAYIKLVKMLYQYYGDRRIVTQHYNNMHTWMNYIAGKYTFEQIIFCDQYGDWLVPPEKVTEKTNKDPRLRSSAEILATTAYLMAIKDMHAFAKLLEREEDVFYYQKKAEEAKAGLYNHLMDVQQNAYGNHTPTELLLLLAAEDLPEAQRSLLLENLQGMLQGQYNGKMTFGMVGMRWLMRMLSENNAVDFAYELATSRAYPSWGYMIDNGATTMWEVWTGKAKDSHNHVVLIGDLLQWFYAYLGGIQQHADGIAFNKLKLLPYLPDGLDSVHVSFLSPRGKVTSRWKKNGRKFRWQIELPVGTTAEVYLPRSCRSRIKHQQFLRLDTLMGNRIYAVYQIGSGQHYFSSFLPKKSKQKALSAPPEISMQDSIIAKKTGEQYLVTLSAKNPKTKIFYTLDGSTPTTNSRFYNKPITLNQHTTIRAIAKEKRKAPSFAKTTFVDIYDPEKNGWKYWYYQKRLLQLPDYDTLAVVDSGWVSVINLDTLKQQRNYWAFRFEAFLEVPASGEYTFYLTSDDGSRLLLDDKVVVNNDGVHYKTQRKGSVILSKGRHRIRLEHFNFWSFHGLQLLVSGPGVARQPLPVSWIFRE